MIARLRVVFSSLVWIGLVGVSLGLPLPTFSADLETIRRRGYLIVAVKDNLPAFGFRNQAGQLEGLEIDIARRLARELLGRPDALVLKPVTNQERLAVVMSGQADLTIARITQTPARSRLVSFSTPYYLDGTSLITRSPAVRRLADLADQKIAVLNGSSTIAALRYALPKSQLIGVDSYRDARRLLEQGVVVAFAADASILSGWQRESPAYRLLPDRLSTEPLGIALPKGVQSDELRRWVDRAIVRWQTEGWLQQAVVRWGLPYR